MTSDRLLAFTRENSIFDTIAHGFGFDGSNAEVERHVLGELTQELENSTLYFSKHPVHPHEVGALLIVGEALYPSTSERSSKLWNSLLKVDARLGNIQGGQLRAIEIGGIFISPTNPHRGREGDARRILREVVRLLQPHFVFGATRSLPAMINRQEALDPLGYVHSVGSFLTSTGIPQEMKAILATAEQGFTPLHGRSWGEQGIVCVDPQYLSASPILQTAVDHPVFGQVMSAIAQAQMSMGNQCTSAVIMVSAPRDLYHQVIPESYT